MMFFINKQKHMFVFPNTVLSIPNISQFVNYKLYYLCYNLWYLNLIKRQAPTLLKIKARKSCCFPYGVLQSLWAVNVFLKEQNVSDKLSFFSH